MPNPSDLAAFWVPATHNESFSNCRPIIHLQNVLLKKISETHVLPATKFLSSVLFGPARIFGPSSDQNQTWAGPVLARLVDGPRWQADWPALIHVIQFCLNNTFRRRVDLPRSTKVCPGQTRSVHIFSALPRSGQIRPDLRRSAQICLGRPRSDQWTGGKKGWGRQSFRKFLFSWNYACNFIFLSDSLIDSESESGKKSRR